MVGPLCMFWVKPVFKNPGAGPGDRAAADLGAGARRCHEGAGLFCPEPRHHGQAERRRNSRWHRAREDPHALTEKLTANGCQVGPQGTIELVASIESKSVEQAFRKLGYVPPTSAKIQTYQLQEFTTRLAFMYQGKPAWQSQAVSLPHLLHAKRGQTIEAALHETEKPNYEFLSRVSLPKKLMKPMPESALGTSNVTVAGVQ